jgi:hypothetical protein
MPELDAKIMLTQDGQSFIEKVENIPPEKLDQLRKDKP